MAALDLSRATWRKSSHSATEGECVEVAALGGATTGDGGAASAIAVRDSKDPSGPALTFTPDSWSAFLAATKAGDFDRR